MKLKFLDVKCILLIILVSLIISSTSFLHVERVKILKELVDDSIKTVGLKTLVTKIFVFIFLLVLVVFLEFFANILGSVNQLMIQKKTKNKYLEMVYKTDFQRLKMGNTSQVLARMFDDLPNVAYFYSLTIPAMISDSLKIALLIYMFSQFSLYFLIIGLLFVPIFSFQIGSSRKKVAELQAKERKYFEEILKFAKESFEGIRVIKFFSVKEMFHKKFREKGKLWVENSVQFTKTLAKTEAKIPFFSSVLPLVIFLLSAYLIRKGLVTFGSAVAFYYFVGDFYQTIGNLFLRLLNLSKNKIYENRLKELFESSCEKFGEKIFEKFENLKLDSVSFSYDSKQVLKDVNLTLKKGEKIAIVANSGNGKSTLVSLFNAFLLPSSGNVFLNDTPIQLYSFDSLRRKIITVSSKDYLFDTSIRNNLTLFEDFSEEEIRRVLDICECQFVYEMENGLDTVIGEEGSMLSDGQKQRITIARALLRKPEVLILDEATSGIDSETEEKILNKIMEEIETVVIISHRLSTIKKAEKIYVMHEGEIEDCGTHEELISKNSRYLQIISSQI